jgi:hypothetical protein
MSFIEAIKEYSKKKGVKYTIPKKGTTAYVEVKKIADRMKKTGK